MTLNTIYLIDIGKIRTAIIIMSLNLPSCEVKNRLTFYKVRWFKYRFCNSVYSMFQKFFADQQIFFLKWRIKWIRFWVQCTLWSTKLLLCFWLEANFFFFFFFFKWSYSQRCFGVAQGCENLRWNRQHCFDVV